MRKFTLLFLALTLGLFSGCKDDAPELAREIPNLITGQCVLPKSSAVMTTVNWHKVFETTPLKSIAGEEVFNTEENLGEWPNVMYCGENYVWNQGHLEGKRVATRLDPNKNYIVIEVGDLITIVTYLMEHVWNQAVSKFMSFIGVA